MFAVQEIQLSAVQQCFWVVGLVPGIGRILLIPAHSPTPDVVIVGLVVVGRWLGPLCTIQITYIVYENAHAYVRVCVCVCVCNCIQSTAASVAARRSVVVISYTIYNYKTFHFTLHHDFTIYL